MDRRDLTRYSAKLSSINSKYYIIMLDGRAHRVCHISQLKSRYPNIKIEE